MFLKQQTCKTEKNLKLNGVPPRYSEFRRISRIMLSRWTVCLGAVLIFVFITMAIFAPFIAPHDPYKTNTQEALQEPSTKHLLGTDSVGRDTLSRVIYGARVSLIIGIVSVGLAATIGMMLGSIAGYYGKLLDNIIMRFIDALMSIPSLILALTFAAILGGGLKNVILALAISMIPEYARLMAGLTRQVKENDYVLAAKIIGNKNKHIILRHIIPNCYPQLMVMITLNLGIAIMAESTLSFLGFGVEPPIAAWGSLISDGYRYIQIKPILSFAPGTAILLVVLSFNLVGDGLRDSLDPRLRGII